MLVGDIEYHTFVETGFPLDMENLENLEYIWKTWKYHGILSVRKSGNPEKYTSSARFFV